MEPTLANFIALEYLVKEQTRTIQLQSELLEINREYRATQEKYIEQLKSDYEEMCKKYQELVQLTKEVGEKRLQVFSMPSFN